MNAICYNVGVKIHDDDSKVFIVSADELDLERYSDEMTYTMFKIGFIQTKILLLLLLLLNSIVTVTLTVTAELYATRW